MADTKFTSAKNDISLSSKKTGAAIDSLTAMPKDVRKRWMMVGGVVAATIVVATMTVSDRKHKPVQAQVEAKPATIDTTPKGINSQADWKSQTGAEVLALQRSLAESQATQKELLARMESLRQEVTTMKTTQPAAKVESSSSKIDLTLPPPPEAPKLKTPQPVAGTVQGSSIAPQAVIPTEPAPVKRTAARAFIPPGLEDESAAARQTVTQKMVPNDKRGFLPAGSFASASLISGVEAFTGQTAQSQPQPLVIRIDENAILPNSAAYRIKGCHVLASVWGNLSSERVYGRLATLTCVDVNNKLVLSEEVEGNIIDSDGKNGVRGEVQDRQGAKLARALMAGFTQGLSEAFGRAQSTTTATASGLTTAITGSTLKAAGYGGAGKAAEQLAEYYMKRAESTMPVIAVDVGRKIQVLFTKSQSLRFESVDAYRVQQEANVTVERQVR